MCLTTLVVLIWDNHGLFFVYFRLFTVSKCHYLRLIHKMLKPIWSEESSCTNYYSFAQHSPRLFICPVWPDGKIILYGSAIYVNGNLPNCIKIWHSRFRILSHVIIKAFKNCQKPFGGKFSLNLITLLSPKLKCWFTLCCKSAVTCDRQLHCK